MEILRTQLLKAGLQPVEHIPLVDICAELTVIVAALNNSEPCDAKRLDHLLRCLEWNKEFNQEDEQTRLERNAALCTIRGRMQCYHAWIRASQRKSSHRNVFELSKTLA